MPHSGRADDAKYADYAEQQGDRRPYHAFVLASYARTATLKAVVLGKQLLADYAVEVGDDAGGILLQLEDGITGYLVRSAEQCAIRITDLLANP